MYSLGGSRIRIMYLGATIRDLKVKPHEGMLCVVFRVATKKFSDDGGKLFTVAMLGFGELPVIPT